MSKTQRFGHSLAIKAGLAGTARESFGQPDELRPLADLLRKGFAGEFRAQFQFHEPGSFNLCRASTSAQQV